MILYRRGIKESRILEVAVPDTSFPEWTGWNTESNESAF